MPKITLLFACLHVLLMLGLAVPIGALRITPFPKAEPA